MTRWLLTGGAGYIGSHVATELLASGRGVVVVDDLSTGYVARIPAGTTFVEGSVQDADLLTRVMQQSDIDGVVHLAAKKAVGESVERPLHYYRENVDGVLCVLTAMNAAGVDKIVYSSSAAAYGEPAVGEVSETEPTVPTSPYGETKLIGEWTVRAQATAQRLAGSGLSNVSLRYFNVAGAGSDELGDTSVANLIPMALRAITNGERPMIFGTDYPTPDGTCIRDYIHVVDLARSHVAAAELCEGDSQGQVSELFNVGRGSGSSVREVLDVISEVLGYDVDPRAVERRPGDPAMLVARTEKIESVLGWKADLDLVDMVRSAWSAWPHAVSLRA